MPHGRHVGRDVESPAAAAGELWTSYKLWIYAETLYLDTSATLDDLREAVTTLEDVGRIARRVFGGAHPLTEGIEGELRDARAALRARDTPSTRG